MGSSQRPQEAYQSARTKVYQAALIPSNDRKVRAYPSQRNTFGLMPGALADGGTCPGATYGPGGCRYIPVGRRTPVCYVEPLMQLRTAVRGVLESNTRSVMQADEDQLLQVFAAEFARFRTQELRRSKPCLSYRLHWAGDVPDERYARALRRAIEQASDIQFWGYTRSLFAVPLLAGVSNLIWYISADPCNLKEAVRVYRQNTDGVFFSMMSKRTPPKYLGKFVRCPVDAGTMPLEGACHKCRACLRREQIWFPLA